MNVGIDFHGVCDRFPELFSFMADVLMNHGHKVYIITGQKVTSDFKDQLSKLDIKYDVILSIVDYHESIGTNVTYNEKGPWIEDEIWNRTKSDLCQMYNIDIHFDDSDLYGKFFDARTRYVSVK